MAKAEVQACSGMADGVSVQQSRITERVTTVRSNHTYRYLTFKRSFRGMHMFHMAAQMVRSAQRDKITFKFETTALQLFG